MAPVSYLRTVMVSTASMPEIVGSIRFSPGVLFSTAASSVAFTVPPEAASGILTVTSSTTSGVELGSAVVVPTPTESSPAAATD